MKPSERVPNRHFFISAVFNFDSCQFLYIGLLIYVDNRLTLAPVPRLFKGIFINLCLQAKDFGIAVNVFWKELPDKFYDPKACPFSLFF